MAPPWGLGGRIGPALARGPGSARTGRVQASGQDGLEAPAAPHRGRNDLFSATLRGHPETGGTVPPEPGGWGTRHLETARGSRDRPRVSVRHHSRPPPVHAALRRPRAITPPGARSASPVTREHGQRTAAAECEQRHPAEARASFSDDGAAHCRTLRASPTDQRSADHRLALICGVRRPGRY